MMMLHLGCGHYAPEGWVNIDKSPSVLLSPLPRVRKALLAARILNPEQAEGLPRGIVHADVTKGIPAPDGTADYAYSEHMIEHLSRWQGLAFIRECRRVLKPGGVLRLATPDLAKLTENYQARTSPHLGEQPTPADAFCADYGAYHDIPSNYARRLIRRLFSGAPHQWLYDYESLSLLLREGGFTTTERCSYRQGQVPRLDQVEFRERSLFVEAV